MNRPKLPSLFSMLKPSEHIKSLARKQAARLAKEREHAQATGIYKWELEAKARLERLRKERGVSYKKLSSLLHAQGIEEGPSQLNRKVNRLKFSAAFYLACIHAMESVQIKKMNSDNHIE